MGIPAGLVYAMVGAALIFVVITIIVIKNCLIVVQPNELVVVTGRKYRAADGKLIPYRIAFGGRFFRIPMLERAHTMDLTLISLEWDLQGLTTRGGETTDIRCTGAVKISSDPTIVVNAVERFMGQSRESIHMVAHQTMAGALRQVVVSITAAELEEDRLLFVQRTIEAASHDLDRLGLSLETLEVHEVRTATGKPAAQSSPASPRMSGASPGEAIPLLEHDLIQLADPLLGNREKTGLLSGVLGQQRTFSIEVSRTTTSKEADLPATHKGGPMIIGRFQERLEVGLCYPTARAGDLAEVGPGDELTVSSRVLRWDGSTMRLVALVS